MANALAATALRTTDTCRGRNLPGQDRELNRSSALLQGAAVAEQEPRGERGNGMREAICRFGARCSSAG